MTTRTAAQRRAEVRKSCLERVAACPTNRLLDRMGDKWVGIVIKFLGDGPLRYGELRRSIPAASQKMLTETLRRLERDGLVSRTVVPGAPVGVDYALTPLGRTLLPVLAVVTGWAEENIARIEHAQEEYDARPR
ncbi:winged helix-turn-helix transcriptional regulator [Nonomuraea rhizosphaerae]|uniref:winged helix-turn-helix transcriptional regulator n=1 Tax=Nonomuraea rhizosphaerae TaxID=2665663 RepID=UPI001C5D602C|nr:helix-turn-helix domain-containing protein [Nonomuraea rhizosphaerae]